MDPIVVFNTTPMSKLQSDKLVECIKLGFNPSIKQWIVILSTLHVKVAIKCVSEVDTLDQKCLIPVIKRRHQHLFREVIMKIKTIPDETINVLMTVNAFYLYVCLQAGLNPNTVLKNKELPLDYACRKSKRSHIPVLLNNSRTIVSINTCRFIIRNQCRFTSKAIQACQNICISYILEVLIINDSNALNIVMEKLEKKFKENAIWVEMTHMLRCPISLEYSTDLVKTPSNHFFDRVCLLTWVRAHANNPMTRETLHVSDLQGRNEFLPELIDELQLKIKQLLLSKNN